jgi:hypothetical protein
MATDPQERHMIDTDLRGVRRTEPRRGDVVRVRSREEILATLDAQGDLAHLPFMPEMLRYTGKQMRVWARADKSCDTIQSTGNRRMENTIHLVGARCDGGAHGGCQAQCMLFFREEWLEWPDAPGRPIAAAPHPDRPPMTEEALAAAAVREDGESFRCQATEHRDASWPMPRHNYTQYLRDVRTRNVTAKVAIWGLILFAFNKYQGLSRRILPSWLQIRGGRIAPFVIPTGTGDRLPRTDLRPGDLVEVKSKEEILDTLGPDLRNNNLLFDAEMLPYCGRKARVLAKTTRILDETTGKMIKLGDCYILEDVICLGLYHRFCQRAITPYWRSAWLRKIGDSAAEARP